MINRKEFLRVGGGVLAGAYVLGLAGCGRGSAGGGGGGEETYNIRFSHVVAPDTPKGRTAEKFKEILEQKTDEQITVEIFPNASLYNDKEEVQGLQSGSIQMICRATAKLSSTDPRLQALDFPFVVGSYEEVPQVVSRDTEIGQQLVYENEKLLEKNIRGLDLWDIGFKHFHANKEIRTPDDLTGLKVRVMSSPVLQTQMETWGAEPTPMGLSEVYSALQQGVIGGGEQTWSNIWTLKFHTVQSHISESAHGYIGNLLAINNEFFNSLPEDLQQSVMEAASEATDYNRRIVQDVEQELKQNIEEEGSTKIIQLSEEERQTFKDEVVPQVWNEYADVVGEDIIEELRSIRT